MYHSNQLSNSPNPKFNPKCNPKFNPKLTLNKYPSNPHNNSSNSKDLATNFFVKSA